MVRFALLGCAAAGLALSAPAHADELDDPALSVASEAQPAAPKVKRVPRKVTVLPPSRPAEESETVAAVTEPAPEPKIAVIAGSAVPLPAQLLSPAPAPASAPAQAPAPAPVQVASIATLPPLRPSFLPASSPVEAAPAIVEQTVANEAETGPIPPPRPEFAEVAAPELVVRAILPPERPAFATDAEPTQTAALQDPQQQPQVQPEPQPQQPRSLFGALFGTSAQPAPAAAEVPVTIRTGHDFLDERIAHHARLNAVPAALVHRVVVRESKYNPRAIGRGGAMGLMQIKHATARGLGYGGTAAGLLDAETNLTYAVKYLAGAYRLADGSFDRAVQHYARGYYYEAKRRNSRVALRSRNERLKQADAAGAIEQSSPEAAAPRSLSTTR
jgi:soluble lytic murein transglycosylase-like protein